MPTHPTPGGELAYGVGRLGIGWGELAAKRFTTQFYTLVVPID